jgi:26S proteasome regulatory subunit N5
MSGEQLLKPEKDFSSEVDKQLPEAEELAKVLTYWSLFWMIYADNFVQQGNLQEAIEKLTALEKQTRQVSSSAEHPIFLSLTVPIGIRPCFYLPNSRFDSHTLQRCPRLELAQ